MIEANVSRRLEPRLSLVTELQGLSSTKFAEIFKKGDITLYVSSLPKNGSALTYISLEEYQKGKGFAVDVKYDVSLNYIETKEESKQYLPENSVAFMADQTKSDNVFATGVTNSNDVGINPNFDAFSVNAGLSILPTYEELLAHEIGKHNMMGEEHKADINGDPVYPQTPTLESNKQGMVYPTEADTKQILSKNIKERSNLNIILTPAQKKLISFVLNIPIQ